MRAARNNFKQQDENNKRINDNEQSNCKQQRQQASKQHGGASMGGLRWCTGLVPCTRENSSASTRVPRRPPLGRNAREDNTSGINTA